MDLWISSLLNYSLTWCALYWRVVSLLQPFRLISGTSQPDTWDLSFDSDTFFLNNSFPFIWHQVTEPISQRCMSVEREDFSRLSEVIVFQPSSNSGILKSCLLLSFLFYTFRCSEPHLCSIFVKLLSISSSSAVVLLNLIINICLFYHLFELISENEQRSNHKITNNGRPEQQKYQLKPPVKVTQYNHSIQASIYQTRKWECYNKGFNKRLVSSSR